MTAELHPSIAEFIHDEDAEYSKAKILSAVRALQQEDRKTRSILRGLLRTLLLTASELETPAHRLSFLEHCQDVLREVISDTDEAIGQLRQNLSK